MALDEIAPVIVFCVAGLIVLALLPWTVRRHDKEWSPLAPPPGQR